MVEDGATFMRTLIASSTKDGQEMESVKYKDVKELEVDKQKNLTSLHLSFTIKTFLHLHKQMFYICPCQCMESSKKQVCQKIGSRPCFGQLGWLGITL